MRHPRRGPGLLARAWRFPSVGLCRGEYPAGPFRGRHGSPALLARMSGQDRDFFPPAPGAWAARRGIHRGIVMIMPAGAQRQPAYRLFRYDRNRLFSLGRVFSLEGNRLSLEQSLEPLALNRGKVDKDVLAPIVRRNKPKTLGLVEPFDLACCHFVAPCLSCVSIFIVDFSKDIPHHGPYPGRTFPVPLRLCSMSGRAGWPRIPAGSVSCRIVMPPSTRPAPRLHQSIIRRPANWRPVRAARPFHSGHISPSAA